jgi:hypothetical protein
MRENGDVAGVELPGATAAVVSTCSHQEAVILSRYLYFALPISSVILPFYMKQLWKERSSLVAANNSAPIFHSWRKLR